MKTMEIRRKECPMTEIRSEIPKSRLVHLDLLRLLAIFLVIFNHTGDRGYTLFVQHMGTPLHLPYMLASIFCKIAVPLFFMISGALLLGREESYRQLFTKRILRMLLVLIIASVPYYLWMHRSNGLSPLNFLSYIYGQSATTSLWYLYSYIGLLLILPFLRKMIRTMQEKDYVYLFVGYLVFVGVIPCLEFILSGGQTVLHESFSAVMFTTQNLFYALIGYYLERVMDKRRYTAKNLWIWTLLSVLALVITGLISAANQMKNSDTMEQIEAYFNCFICVPAITVYSAVKHFASKLKGERLNKWLSILGSAVFGVYLIEKIVRAFTGFVYTWTAPILGSLTATLLWVLSVLCISLVIIVALKHIPLVKKAVNKLI